MRNEVPVDDGEWVARPYQPPDEAAELDEVPEAEDAPRIRRPKRSRLPRPAGRRNAEKGAPRLQLKLEPIAGLVLAVLFILSLTQLAGFARLGVTALLLVGILILVMHSYGDRILPSRHKPAGPVPRKGPRGLLWKTAGNWFYARFGWQWLTVLSVRERTHNAKETLWNRRKTMKIVAFCNSKGGSGKSTVATWLSVYYADVIKRHVLAFDVNDSPGGTADRLGIGRSNTITLRRYLDRCGDGSMTFSAFTRLVDWHRETGVSVVASERAQVQSFKLETFERGLDVAKQNAHAVFCDCGNQPFAPGNLGSMRKAHTLVFVGNVNMNGSLEDLRETVESYAEYDEGAFAEKVSKSVIIILGAKAKDRERIARKYRLPLEQVFVIPRNRYMEAVDPDDLEKDARLKKPVRLGKIPRKIEAIVYEALVAIMEDKGVEMAAES